MSCSWLPFTSGVRDVAAQLLLLVGSQDLSGAIGQVGCDARAEAPMFVQW
jgi:hypothetical protein